MAILVTGGAGYIGSVTVDQLRAKDQDVVVLDDLNRGHRSNVHRDVPFYHGRVGDRTLVARIAAEHRIEACVHFAALAYVGESVLEPAKYFENNVEQGIALMGALPTGWRSADGLLFYLRNVWRTGPNSYLGELSAVAYQPLRLVEARYGARAGILRPRLRTKVRSTALLQRSWSDRAPGRTPRAGTPFGSECTRGGLGRNN